MKKSKTPADSRTEFNIIIRPADVNSLGACFGGTIMQWMDMTASICARRHSNVRVNTVKAEEIKFIKPLQVGHVAHLVAAVVRVFHSSMEVHVQVYAEDTYSSTSELAASAVFIFVGLNENMRPVKVYDLKPSTTEEQALWEKAGERRDRQKQRQNKSG